ncbi:MAG: DUF2786 domain-containing protein [Proteobacteria bacterium]|nr:DUF2786 domain-containing protein [Pseudomonadota bacterium]
MAIERIKKLVALAGDQAGTPEGESAMRMARQLMVEHSIELAQLQADERDAVDPFDRRPLDLAGRAHWRRQLLSMVAQHCECIAGWSRTGNAASLYGRKSAVEIAEYLFLVLLRQVTMERAAFMVDLQLRGDDPDGIRRTRDFCQSALLALRLRFEQLRGIEPEESTALVRQSARGLGDWMENRGHKLAPEPPFGFRYDAKGYQAGYRIPLVDAVEG